MYPARLTGINSIAFPQHALKRFRSNGLCMKLQFAQVSRPIKNQARQTDGIEGSTKMRFHPQLGAKASIFCSQTLDAMNQKGDKRNDELSIVFRNGSNFERSNILSRLLGQTKPAVKEITIRCQPKRSLVLQLTANKTKVKFLIHPEFETITGRCPLFFKNWIGFKRSPQRRFSTGFNKTLRNATTSLDDS